ncbi:carbohydrate ABC transporter permease [Jatrophihabitans fulvus]
MTALAASSAPADPTTRRPRRDEGRLRVVLVALAALITVAPLVVVALVAFNRPNTPVSGASWPSDWSLAAFGNAWTFGAFASAMRASMIISVCVVAIVVVFATLAGYAFAILRFPGSTVLFYVILAGMAVPFNVMIVPLYFEFESLGLSDSLLGIVLPESGIYLAFGVFWMRAFFLSVPTSIIESARLDGANSLQVLTGILLPIGRPALLTLTMLTFLSSWNEYLVPLVMANSDELQTAPLRLAVFQGQYLSDTPSLAAAALIVAGPPVVLYILTQRTFFRGLLEGAVK